MKLLIWILAILIVIGGIFYFTSSEDTTSSDSTSDSKIDSLSESGRVLDTDTAVFNEIDDALDAFE